jgi:hypothetical protein
MQDTASDAKDVDNFSHRPHLPPPVSDEEDKRLPPDSDAEDKDEDVDGDAVEALLVLLPDGDPPSQLSQQDGHQGTRQHRPRAEDIMRHHLQCSMSRPLRIQTSQRGMRIGMHVIHAVLTCPKDIPARHARITCVSRTTTSISPGRMRSSTSIKGTTAQLRTATRRFSRRCDG